MLCHYNVVDFGTSKSNTINEPIIQSCTFGNTKKSSQKLPKLGLFSQKYTNKAFRTTVSRGGALDERYYKEATKSRKMSSTTRSKFRNSRYDNDRKKGKEASNIDEESNEGSSSDKKISGNDNENSENGSNSGSGSGSGEGSELNKSKSGNGSEDGSGNGSGDGDGDGDGDE